MSELIAKILTEEGPLVRKIREATGVDLPNLTFLRAQRGGNRARLMETIAHLLETDPDTVPSRWSLYLIFGEAGAFQYLPKLKKWYAEESERRTRFPLEVAIVNNSRGDHEATCNFLLDQIRKVGVEGLVYLVRQGSERREVLDRLRALYVARQLDTDTLAFAVYTQPAVYDAITRAAGAERLTARQCGELLDHQLPPPEAYFRRPDLVPFYGSIIGKRPIHIDDLTQELQGVVADGFLQEIPAFDAASAAKRIRLGKCAAVCTIQTGSGTRSIVLLLQTEDVVPAHRTRHRARSGARVVAHSGRCILAIVDVPAAEEWNVYPKNLLPPDHPLRHARPEE